MGENVSPIVLSTGFPAGRYPTYWRNQLKSAKKQTAYESELRQDTARMTAVETSTFVSCTLVSFHCLLPHTLVKADVRHVRRQDVSQLQIARTEVHNTYTRW